MKGHPARPHGITLLSDAKLAGARPPPACALRAQVHEEESSPLASDLMRNIGQREPIAPNQGVLHSDQGGPMKGATLVASLQTLWVIASLIRPAVSNDNP